MLREFCIFLYLTFFRLLFNAFKLFPLKNKTVFVASFGDNINVVAEELAKHSSEQEIIILKTAHCKVDFSNTSDNVFVFNSINLVHFFKSIFHLATSRYIFIDNYFGFLAVTNFKDSVKCVQLWHAAGAIKQFGLQDLSNENRSQRALKRFQDVYNRFNYVVVGSDKMVHIFKQSFNLSDHHFIRTGIPRTDFFFRSGEINAAKKRMQQQLPNIDNKKIMLYAPTYRDDELTTIELQLDLDKLYEHFKDDYILLLRLHPAMAHQINVTHDEFIYDMSHYPNINDLLVYADLLITDYSSIPFEYALLNKPMIFFAYDLDKYSENRGLIKNYEQFVPGTVVKTMPELIQTIKTNSFQLNKIQPFAQEWNKYSVGHSAERLIHTIYSDVDIFEEANRAMENV